MDKKDQIILEELRKDSRQTTRELSQKTKLRPSTVHSRIQKLVRDQVIERFTVKTSNSKIGQNFIVFILVSTSRKVPDSFFDKENIKEVFGITGEYDLIMKCKFRDIEDFNRFVLEFRNYPQIVKTLTMVATLNLKEEL